MLRYTILLEAMRALVHIGIHILHNTLSTYQVFSVVAGDKFSVDIDNNALDITLDQFFLFNTFYIFFIYFIYFCILPILHLCLLLGLYCLFVVLGG